jgi:hypothetical protein
MITISGAWGGTRRIAEMTVEIALPLGRLCRVVLE